MRVKTTAKFERILKRYKKRHFSIQKLFDAVDCIVNRNGQVLKTKYRDYALTVKWSGYRELHIEGDWLLIYIIDYDELILLLVDTGSHDNLF